MKNGNVTPEQFLEIKTMLSIPLTKVDIEARTGRSYSTITRIEESPSYEGYQTLVKTQNQKYSTKDKMVAKKAEKDITFGKRQVPEENVVEPITEGHEPTPTANSTEVKKFDELVTLEREILQAKKDLLAINKELVEQDKKLNEALTAFIQDMKENNEAVKSLVEALNS